MGKIVIRPSEEVAAKRSGDTPIQQRPAHYAQLSAEQLATTRGQYFPTSDEGLQLLEIRIEPNVHIDTHAHTQSEIIYITAGEIQVGARTCGPGTAIYIDAETLYQFRSGPDGVSFLNFRGNPDVRYLTKEEFLTRRTAVGNDS
jgi:redox-sensitive bicupin YhaK (pirin superfamily)